MRSLALLVSGLLVLLCGSGASRAQTPAGEWFTLTSVGANVWAAIDNPQAKQRSYANAGVVIGEDGVVVIDTLTGDEAAGHLLKEIRRLTPLPVKFVVNTHYHGDHVAGNALFAAAGARVIAHRNVRRWIHSENVRLLGDKPNPDLKTFIERFQAPTMVYTDAVDLYAGSRAIEIRSFPGHTGGDSVVIVPDAKVVFAGDLLWRSFLPNTVDGSTKAWIQTLDAFVRTYPDHTFIPGHGGVASVQDVTAFREYLATVQRLVAEARASGKSGDAVVQSVMPLLKATHGKFELFDYMAPRNIAEADAEQGGTKRIPQ